MHIPTFVTHMCRTSSEVLHDNDDNDDVYLSTEKLFRPSKNLAQTRTYNHPQNPLNNYENRVFLANLESDLDMLLHKPFRNLSSTCTPATAYETIAFFPISPVHGYSNNNNQYLSCCQPVYWLVLVQYEDP